MTVVELAPSPGQAVILSPRGRATVGRCVSDGLNGWHVEQASNWRDLEETARAELAASNAASATWTWHPCPGDLAAEARWGAGRHAEPGESYSIAGARLAVIVRLVQRRLREAGVWQIRAYCLAERPDGEPHQYWLDTAPPENIAQWIVDTMR